MNTLTKVLDLTLRHNLDQSCDSNSPNKLVIKGQYVKISDITTSIKCPKPIEFIEIFALNKVFINTDLDKTGEKIQLSIIAPTWDIQGIRKIILDGKPGETHKIVKARDGIASGSRGEDGKPRLPAGSAGNFLGIGETCINAQDLTISANGGKGGPGQHGGDGAKGKKGEEFPDNLSDHNEIDSLLYSKNFFYVMGPLMGSVTGARVSVLIEVGRVYKIYGKDGGNGGIGGNGGMGGNGGNPGNVIIISFLENTIPKFSVREGEKGLNGIGGEQGNKGRTLNIKLSKASGFSISKETHYFSDTDNKIKTTSTSGNPGSNILEIQKPEAIALLNPSHTINSYKNYFRENLSGSIRESDLRDFLNLLEKNKNVIDSDGTVSRSRRHHHGENHQRVQRDIDDSNNVQYDTDGIIVAADSTANEIKNNILNLKNQDMDIIGCIIAEDTKFVGSTASNVKSPINTVINWLGNSLGQLKFFNLANMINYEFIKDSIQSMFGESKQLNSYTTNYNNNAVNIAKFNVNESLILADFVIRCITKVKPYNTKEESINLLEIKAYLLNITTEFEEILNELSVQNNLSIEDLEFNPVDLMYKLEKEIINNNYTKIAKILYQSIINNNAHLDGTQFSSYIQDKINEMLTQQNTECLYNQQLITDNSHIKVDDISNVMSIANDFNHTCYQSEVNLIG